MLNLKKPIVSVEWLHDHLEFSNLIILDATIPKVTGGDDVKVDIQIPNALFFDLKGAFSDVSASFPSTFPSEAQFTKSAQTLGINKDSAIVVYDEQGIYSSARAWWMFKAMGHTNIAVLDGGLPEWIQAGYRTEPKKEHTPVIGNFIANYRSNHMKYFEDIKEISVLKSHIIMDARSENRFKGIVPEPREGLRSGTIPNSVNLPYTDLLEGYRLSSVKELEARFNAVAKKEDALVFSCGSGITACILALGAELSGYKNLSVYDGSWTEWGSLVSE